MSEYKKYFIVKAIGHFSARHHDELSIEPRDILQVIKKIDKYWYLGFKTDQKGKFPSSKVVEVNIQHELKNSIGIYIAVNTFTKEQDGDLQLNRNDIIIATRKVDDHWLEGRLLNVPGTGIFPSSNKFVWKLRENVEDECSLMNNRSPIRTLTYATVLHSMEAQLEDELDLKKDDTVIILGDHDSMYYKGELMNGRQGIFPKNFVSIIKDTCSSGNKSINRNSSISNHHSIKNHSSNSHHLIDQNYEIDNLPSYSEVTSVYNNVQTDIPAYGRTLYEFRAENNNEISFKENQLVNLIRYVDANWIEIELDNQVGLAPKNYIEIIVDCENGDTFNQEYSSEVEENCYEEEKDVEIEEFPPDTWGRVQYDFRAQMDGDLNLKTGDVIRLIRKFNNAWIEAYNQSQLGICPLNYIEIISPYEDSNTQKSTSFFDCITPPDNLIQFSPEKKDDQNNQVSNNQNSSQKVNYDVLHEIENDYELTVFKDVASRSAYEIKHEKRVDNLDDKIGLQSSNSSVKTNKQINSLNEEISFRQKNDYNKFDKSQTEIIRPPARPVNIYTSNNSTTNDSFKYSNDQSASNLTSESSKSTYNSIRRQESTEIDNSSFVSELNKSISNRNQKRNLPETPRRPALPPTPKLDRSSQSNSRNSLNSSFRQSKENESQKYRSSQTIESNYKNSFENKNYLATDTQTSDANDTKLTNNRLAKMAEQRSCIITELLQSEKDYRHALEVCCKTFLKNEKFTIAFAERNVDLKSIFSNLDEIILVSERLNERLKNEMIKDANSQLIGKCFLDLEREMGDAYGFYCRNHDDVLPAFERYSQDSEINRFFQLGLNQIRAQTNCFDIPSILIKPLQRILKYPLMLNELIKCTPNDSRDFEHLQNAVKSVTDLATNINEFKRRKDLVFKYRKEAERSNSFSSKLSKLNLHTIKKKYSRFNYKITSTIGLSNKNKDADFDVELSKFRSLEKSIKIFLKNLSLLIEQLDVYVKTTYSLTEEIVILYGDKCKQLLIKRAKECHYEMLNKSISELKSKIEMYIVEPLKRLLEKFVNPEILIRKRKDKAIDLECASNKYQSNREGARSKQFKDEFIVAKEVYEALNQQLIQDLPMFSSFGIEIFTNCIIAFIAFFKKFIGNIVKQMLELLSLPPIEGCKINCSNDIVETFQVKHNLIAKKLVEDFHIVPNNIFPQVMNSQTLAVAALDKHKLMKNSKILNAGSAARNKSNYQTKENRLAILSNSKIVQESIFIVKENFEPNDVGDLFALKDDIVVVIKKKDPTGHSLRWFVDNGNHKGFLPARILEPKNSLHPSYADNGYHSSSYLNYNSLSSTNSSCSQANSLHPSLASDQQTAQYPDQWSRSSSNIYSEIAEPTSFLPQAPSLCSESEELALDDFDPFSRCDSLKQQVYESINAQSDKETDDINLNRKDPPVNEYYRAAYEFKPVGEKQLSLQVGEIVIVKYKSDLHNNDEWWYVENVESQCGYVPSTYLYVP